MRRTVALLLWWTPWILLPLASWFSPSLAIAVTTFLLGIDVPLTLLLAVVTAALAARARDNAQLDDWLGPARFQPWTLRWLQCMRRVMAARWPLGLAIAALLLRVGLPEPLRLTAPPELALMGALALGCGLGFAWVSGSWRARHGTGVQRARRGAGMAALSWAPLHEARSGLAFRRLSVLALPALLAAPAGAQLHQAMEVLLVFLAAAAVATLVREARLVQTFTRRWLRDAPMSSRAIAWWSWRFVAAGLVALVALLALWPPGPSSSSHPS